MRFFIGVILDHAHTYKTVVKEIESIPEVTECHFITGGFYLLIKLRCNDHQHLMDILINTLQNIPGIAKTETFISLDQTYRETDSPIPTGQVILD